MTRQKSIVTSVSFDQETYDELKKQMKEDYRFYVSEYLRFLIWKEHNQRRNKEKE